MTPSVVHFTGADFDPKLLSRRLRAPTPADWIRHQFTTDGFVDPEWNISEWLTNNLFGRWTLNFGMTLNGMVIVVGFEQANDAVMFRLMEGETAWREDTDKVL
jgi:hypothetical protein